MHIGFLMERPQSTWACHEVQEPENVGSGLTAGGAMGAAVGGVAGAGAWGGEETGAKALSTWLRERPSQVLLRTKS